MTLPLQPKPRSSVTTAAGAAVTVLAGAVLAGWALDAAALKSVFPGLVTMKANTAAGLLLSGAALWLLSGEKVLMPIRVVTAVMAAAAALGILTLGEYFLDTDFGIDQRMFLDTLEAVGTSHPARMSPVSALCFVLAGTALLAVSCAIRWRLRHPIVGALGAAEMVIGGLALAGYLLEGALDYRLWNYTGTAIHTAVGFVLLGLGLLALVRSEGGLTWSLNTATTAGFLIAVALIVVAAGNSYHFTTKLQRSATLVSQTQEVLKGIQGLSADMAELESSQRGYIITGDERELDRREQAKAEVRKELSILNVLTADDPNQHSRLGQLMPLIDGRIDWGERTIAIRRQQGFPAAQKMITTGTGFALSDGIHLMLREMLEEEYRLLGGRRTLSEAASVTTLLFLPMALFLTLTMLSLGVFFLNASVGERQKAERSARESQARMIGVVDSAMDAIISVDAEQKIVLFNTAAEKLFRCPAAAAIGQSIDKLIPPRYREQHSGHVEDFRITGVTTRSLGSLRALSGLRADGEEFPIEASISQIEVAGQKLFTVILRDMTERKRSEEALRASEAQLQTIVESLTEGVAVSGLDGQLLHFNRAALKMLGFTGHDGWRRHLAEFESTFELSAMDGTVWSVDQWPLARILRGETLSGLEARIRRKDSDWRRVFSYGGALVNDAGGRPLIAVVTISDITERELAAEEIRRLNGDLEQRVIRRTSELENANKELEAFSYSISHDLRAPLRAVDGYSQALIEDFGSELPEEGRRYLRTIRQGAQRMGALIDDLLSFSRLSRLSVSKRRVDAAALVREVLVELKWERNGRRISVEIGDLPSCHGDPVLLKQVWVNLLSNALKYTRGRDPAVVDIGCQTNNGEPVYFVRDNGTGFDMKYAHKLFGVFQRLHREEEFEGTGVGLAIVQRVIHGHGGRVWADAEVGGGATFYFTLGEERHEV